MILALFNTNLFPITLCFNVSVKSNAIEYSRKPLRPEQWQNERVLRATCQ
jgi:hypothetical protein